MAEDVLFTVDSQQIAHLTLNKPDKHNAFDQEMVQKLMNHFRNLQENTEVRALIIQGNGKSFCAGADLSWMANSAEISSDQNFEEAHSLSTMLYFLDTLPMPTLTYAHGAVMGGGLGILACSDLVIADPQTLFGFTEVKVGLVPATIAPFVLRKIGISSARRYFLTGETFSFSVAQQMGLVDEGVALEKKEEGLSPFIHHILRAGPQAVGKAKKLIRQITGDVTENTRLMTIELIANMRLSGEGQSGIQSFLKKSPPPWVPKGIGDD